jgi:hypothetical protein
MYTLYICKYYKFVFQSAGLLLVHAHSRLFANSVEQDTDIQEPISGLIGAHYLSPSEPLWQFYLRK